MSDHTRVNQQSQEIPYGYCHCGCGQLTRIAEKTNVKMGRRKGYPVRFVHGHNARFFDDSPSGYKTCAECEKVKPIEDYYLHATGRRESYCKECARAFGREQYHADHEAMKARNNAYRQRNKEELSAKERERRADPAYREQCAQELKEWRSRNREHVAAYNRSPQVNARSAVNKAVRSGKLPPAWAMVCGICQEAQGAEYHHYNGYEPEHWFDVEVTCTECHGREHRVD